MKARYVRNFETADNISVESLRFLRTDKIGGGATTTGEGKVSHQSPKRRRRRIERAAESFQPRKLPPPPTPEKKGSKEGFSFSSSENVAASAFPPFSPPPKTSITREKAPTQQIERVSYKVVVPKIFVQEFRKQKLTHSHNKKAFSKFMFF